MRIVYSVLFCMLLGIVSCSKSEDVYRNGTDARVQVKSERGTCTDINTYESGSYWSESWWYWSQGIEYTFSKSERIEESKTQSGLTTTTTKTHYMDIVIDSTYVFTPTSAPQKTANSIKSKETKLRDYIYIEPVKYW